MLFSLSVMTKRQLAGPIKWAIIKLKDLTKEVWEFGRYNKIFSAATL